MKINTALILCAGFGKRLNPITLSTPKPLLEIKNITMLERCIDLIVEIGAKKILLNTFHLENQILEFIKKKKFPIDIQVIQDGQSILDTGGGILNMINNSQENDFIIFNPDTLWNRQYISEIKQMSEFYFSNNLNNILLLTNKKKSFDKNLKGDFSLKDDLIIKKKDSDLRYIYTGLQIINPEVFLNINEKVFSINKIWDKLIEKEELFAIRSDIDFHHVSNLDIYKKLIIK